jgi:hypothetical protein
MLGGCFFPSRSRVQPKNLGRDVAIARRLEQESRYLGVRLGLAETSADTSYPYLMPQFEGLLAISYAFWWREAWRVFVPAGTRR